MDNLLTVIEKPLITERATRLKAQANQYVFRVSAQASKRDIKLAVEKFFKVKVRGVNTLFVHGKFRRMGRSSGAYRADWKKAIVTLQTGQEIKDTDEVK